MISLEQTAKSAKLASLHFIYNSTLERHKARCDVALVLRYLQQIQVLGIKVELTDTNAISEPERMNLYSDAITGSVIQKAEIRRVFGSNRYPGTLFGKEVPALLVLEREICTDVYPQRRSLVDGQEQTIESYLENTIKALEFSPSEKYIKNAKDSLDHGLSHAAILYSLLALDGFIWRVLWGKKDSLLIGPDGRRHPFSSIDFVYRYSRKSEADFPYPEQFRSMKERNKGLFRELRDSDGFLLKQAVKEGFVNPHETDRVKKLRIIRNFCAHFNPFEKTLSQYRDAIISLGLDPPTSFSRLDAVAVLIVKHAENLVGSWKSRINID